MTEPAFQVKLWGTRGGLPVAGPQFQTFGGNTTCFEVVCGDQSILFDAGSGLPAAGRELREAGSKEFALFFSHFHYDHVMGLPFLLPLYCPQTRVRIWSGHMAGKMTTQQMMSELMREPFFPIGPELCCADIAYIDFVSGDVLSPFDGIKVRTTSLTHPGGAIGYRVEFANKTIAIVTDTEHTPGVLDPVVLDLIKDVDLFLYDSNFEDDEMERFAGFGHSSWQQAIKLAQAAGAKRVGFVHHAKFRNDAALLRIEAEAQALFPAAFCGRDYQVIDI